MSKNDIAIIGMACKFPQANSIEEYWNMLKQGTDAISKVPENRWDIDQFYDADLTAKRKMNTQYGGFIDDVEFFDAPFFGISPREAAAISPQQRILLETSWNALENAAIPPNQISGKPVGCFMGVASFDYYERILENKNKVDGYTLTGNAYSVTANRISYAMNLTGPSLAIDTACSSSLVAIHYACQSLLNGESELALAGGTQVIVSPWVTVAASKGAFMAPDGRCKTFDASANGYVRGEGAGVVVLKKLDKAIADNDPILAIIKGSAVNQDGKSNGLTAPNLKAQQMVLEQAYANANVSPADVGYIEAHGTGTPLGDPIEVSALSRVLSQQRQDKQSCLLGSVKTNIGHLEAAAGIAGLIKSVLCIQREEIPPNVHFNQPNAAINFESSPFKVSNKLQKWLTKNNRIAGISSFGFGGTNAHVVVKQTEKIHQKNNIELFYQILMLSAKTKSALMGRIKTAISLLKNKQLNLTSLIASFAVGVQHFKHRLTIKFNHQNELLAILEEVAKTKSLVQNNNLKYTYTKNKNKIAFLFTGQGSQYYKMGKELYIHEPIFKSTIDQCHQYLKEHFNIELTDKLFSELSNDEMIKQTAIAQPAIFSIEVALYELIKSWGIKPSFMMGHSLGEYAAIYAAGMINLENALKLVASRGALMQKLNQVDGAMVSVFIQQSELNQYIDEYSDCISVAAINGMEHTVISGEKNKITLIIERLKSHQIKYKALEVSHAFHSPLMKPMLNDFAKVIDLVKFNKGNCELISNVTGQVLSHDVDMKDYLIKHIIEPVQFVDSINTLKSKKVNCYCELGPKAVLSILGSSITGETKSFVYAMQPTVSNKATLTHLISEFYLKGIEVNWKNILNIHHVKKINLPGYQFDKHRYWMIDNLKETAHFTQNQLMHPFLENASTEKDEQGRDVIKIPLSTELFPYLDEHKVHGINIIPSTVFIELAQSVGKYLCNINFEKLGNLQFMHPFSVTHQEKIVKIIIDINYLNEKCFFLGTDNMDVNNEQTICAQGKYITINHLH